MVLLLVDEGDLVLSYTQRRPTVLLNSYEVRSGQVRTRSESKNGQVDFTLR